MSQPNQPTHNSVRIRYALAMRGYLQIDVASECGVKPGTISAVIHGRSRSKKIENRIACITRMPLADLWPQWHGPNARTKRRRQPSSAQIANDLQALAG